MEKLDIKTIQEIGFNMMKDIHSFCVSHDIKYTLSYGSMIGAIRHKGFIPWDDDIDIMMPRKDLEKFVATYKSDQYDLVSLYDKDNLSVTSRLCDKKTLVEFPLSPCKRQVGIFIDICPIDGLPDVEAERKEQYNQLLVLYEEVVKNRVVFSKIQHGTISEKVRNRLYNVKQQFQGRDSRKALDEFNQLSQKCEFGKTEFCANLTCISALVHKKEEILYTEDFSEYQLMPFETAEFYVAKGYDRILKMTFGDYMTIPPKEQQVSHALNHFNFRWR